MSHTKNQFKVSDRLNGAAIQILFIFLFLIHFNLNAQQKRYALVIGAKSYISMPPLRNSVNDAKLISDVLQKKNFKVDVVLDPADRNTLKAAITKYYETMKNEVDAVGIIYYAGHGVQYNGANYIVPTNAVLKNPGDLNEQCVNMNSVIDVLKSLKHCLNMFLIDACRSYPTFYRDSEEGLAKVQVPEGSIIVYAAQPGKKASDGSGENGLFTARLVENINEGNLKLAEVFRQVRNEVYKDSEQTQLPEVDDNTIGGDFYFNPIVKTVERPKEVSTIAQSQVKQQTSSKTQPVNPTATKKTKDAQAKLTQSEQAEKMVEQKNYYEAKRRLEPLVQNGDARAQAILANMYFNGWGVEKDLIQCLKLNESAALAGDSRGQRQLASMYLNGWGVAKNDEEAIKWYTYAAENKSDEAIVQLGNYYVNRIKSDPGNAKTAFDWFMKGAEHGDKISQYAVGELYRTGRGVAKDPSEAMKWLSLSANQKYDQAIVQIGKMYETGEGVSMDKSEAVKWYHTAAFNGSALGQYWLGLAFEKGNGVNRNMEEAIANFKKAAEQGERDAMFQLGHIYYTGEGGVNPDFWTGVNWLEKSANAGNVYGSKYLATIFSKEGPNKNLDQEEKWLKFSCGMSDAESMYLYGTFLLKKRDAMNNVGLYDPATEQKQKQLGQEAVEWFKKGASAGNAMAINQMGILYGKTDPNKAMEYFKQAAAMDLPVAMFNVGYIYETEKAFGKNKEEAIKWYRMASDKGFQIATERLKKLEKKK